MGRLALKAVQQEYIEGGLADGKSLEDIANRHGVTLDHIEEQMKMGVQVEMEHTNDANIAAEIARDHLWEDPDYYTKLAKMEGEEDESDLAKSAKVRKDDKGYKLVSKKDPSKVLKRWDHKPSKKEVREREKQIEMFKHMKGMRRNTLALLRIAFNKEKWTYVNQDELKKLEQKFTSGTPITLKDLIPVIGVDAATTLNVTTDLTPQQIAKELIFTGRNALQIKEELSWKGYGEKPSAVELT